MKIVGFGDSFTVGIMGQHERSYIAELCKLPNSKFSHWENYAAGGSSNWAIAFQVYRYVMENVNNLQDTFIFIAWSSFSRFSVLNRKFDDHLTNYHDAYRIPNRRIEEPFTSYKVLIYETDVRILGIVHLLQKYGVPYAMIQAFDDHSTESFSAIKSTPNWINQQQASNTLMHIIAERYLDPKFESVKVGENHNEPGWISKLQSNQYISDCYHPTDQGNQLIAETLYPYLIQLLK